MLRIIVFAVLLVAPFSGFASVCDKEDFENWVSAKKKCTALQPYSEIDKSNRDLVIILGGDNSKGVAVYESLIQLAGDINSETANIFFLARPGYKTDSGLKSSGGNPRGPDRGDNYVWKRNIEPVGYAIRNLTEFYSPERVIAIGHSGGAATIGVLIGRMPGLIDEAVLIACPCFVREWRRHRELQRGGSPTGRKLWPKSDSPHEFVDKVSTDTRINLIVGANDQNTLPKFTEEYYSLLKETNENVYAKVHIVPDANHRSIVTKFETISIVQGIKNEPL